MPPARDPSRLSIDALEDELSRRSRHDRTLLDACHELSEPLTALANYLEVQRRLIEGPAGIGTVRIAEILGKMSAQVSRSGQILARLRQLLQGGLAEHPMDADEEAVGRPQPGGMRRLRGYRVNFIDEFARAGEVFQVRQRSIFICCAGRSEQACEAAKVPLAELESDPQSRLHAWAIEVFPLDVDAALLELPDGEQTMPNSRELRKLAAWYRKFAERAGNPAIWEGRLRTAAELEAEADRVEREPPPSAANQTRTSGAPRR